MHYKITDSQQQVMTSETTGYLNLSMSFLRKPTLNSLPILEFVVLYFSAESMRSPKTIRGRKIQEDIPTGTKC